MFLLLLYGAGLRSGEARRLTIGDVDLEEAVLTVRDTKFFKNRLVPVCPQTRRCPQRLFQTACPAPAA